MVSLDRALPDLIWPFLLEFVQDTAVWLFHLSWGKSSSEWHYVFYPLPWPSFHEPLRNLEHWRVLFLVFNLQTLHRSELCLPVFMCVDISRVLKEKSICSALSATSKSNGLLSVVLQSPVIIHPVLIHCEISFRIKQLVASKREFRCSSGNNCSRVLCN